MKFYNYIFLFFSFFLQAQEEISAVFMDSTVFSYVQFLGKEGEFNYGKKNTILVKENGKKIIEYANPVFGEITGLDSKNPLQLVVFYEGFNAFVVLDNQLNEIKSINLNTLDEPVEVEAFGLAKGNKIWIYDMFSQKIGFLDFIGESIQLISNPIIAYPKYYQSDYNNFYWITEENKFYSISVYGKITQLDTLPVFETVFIIDGTSCIYYIENELYYYDTTSRKSTKISIPEKSFENYYFKNGILSIFTQKKVVNYKINLP